MIRSFRNKNLEELWTTGRTSKIDVRLQTRVKIRLSRLNAVQEAADMNLPGFNFHSLRGFQPVRYSVHVNGPWCLTFVFEQGDAHQVDFEQYH